MDAEWTQQVGLRAGLIVPWSRMPAARGMPQVDEVPFCE
jgi:hypothetical protein